MSNFRGAVHICGALFININKRTDLLSSLTCKFLNSSFHRKRPVNSEATLNTSLLSNWISWILFQPDNDNPFFLRIQRLPAGHKPLLIGIPYYLGKLVTGIPQKHDDSSPYYFPSHILISSKEINGFMRFHIQLKSEKI